MIRRVHRWVRSAYERSPRDNFSRLATKLGHLGMSGKNGNGAELATASAPAYVSHANGSSQPRPPAAAPSAAAAPQKKNDVLPDFLEQPIYKKLIAWRLRNCTRHVVFLGSAAEIAYLSPAFLARPGCHVVGTVWDWDADIQLDSLPADAPIVICKVPTCDREWWAVKKLKDKYGPRIVGIQELVLPFSTLEMARSLLPFHAQSLEALTAHYTGEQFFGPLDQLDAIFPLKGKSVIEFGPMDGYQTAGLLKLGAASVSCIEARPENVLKTIAASQAFGWNNVRLIMDDFHNADHWKYGTFDLAFAHGVYYHSLCPFLFLENLLSLSSNVFVGGFCATDALPGGDFFTLVHNNESYRVKPYRETLGFFTAGVNPYGYYFHGDDLLEFFRRRDCEITLISDEVMPTDAGWYLRFLARKKYGSLGQRQ